MPIQTIPSEKPIRLSLGRKLGLGFATMTVLSMCLGGLALNRMQSTNRTMDAIRTNYMPSTVWGGKIGVGIEQVARLAGNYLRVPQTDQVGRQVVRDRLDAAIAAVNTAREHYDPLIDDGEERDHYTSIFDRLWPRLLADAHAIVQLRDAGQADAAEKLCSGSFRDETDTLDAFVNWDMNYNRTQGDAAVVRSQAVSRSTTWMISSGVLAVLILSLVITLGLTRHIAGAISALTAAMRRLADRDMQTEIPCAERTDEIGRMATAVQVFKDNMIAADRLSREQEAESQARQQRSERLEALVGSFEQQIGSTVAVLASASTEMEATARSMTGNAAETDQRATAVAEAAAESNLGVQTVAAASEQLASSITEINRQVSTSSSLTDRCVGSVRQTDGTVRALAESAERIGHVVELISSIARQTNLLALNATIEAARAGDAGKGFAVVASEVKNLAQQTAKATDDIGTQISQVQQASAAAVSAIRDISGMIEEVGAITTSIAAAVEEQGAATNEIARNVQQTALSTGRVTSNISGVSKAVNDTGAAASQVLSAAGDLSRQAESLSLEVSGFIQKVRVV